MVDLVEPGAVTSGRQVTNAGTDIALTAGVCRTVYVKALDTNGGLVYVGPVGVAAATGLVLRANEGVWISVANRNLVYFDVSVNGEGITWLSVA